MKNFIDYIQKNQGNIQNAAGGVMTVLGLYQSAKSIVVDWNGDKQQKIQQEEEKQARIKHENKQQLREDMEMVKAIFIHKTDEEIAFDLNMLDEDEALRLIDLYLKGKKSLDTEAVLHRQIINLASGTYSNEEIINAFVTKSLHGILKSFLSKTEQECREVSEKYELLPETNPWADSSTYKWLTRRYKDALTALYKDTNIIIRSCHFRGINGTEEYQKSLQKLIAVAGQKNHDKWFNEKHEIQIMFVEWQTQLSLYYTAYQACRNIKNLYDIKGNIDVERAVIFLENYVRLG